MLRNTLILAVLAAILALPFLFRRSEGVREWRAGDPVLVVVTPMNEAIRHEYAIAFSKWHAERFGAPVKIDWRNIGGSSEISRYLRGEFVSAFKAWCAANGVPWRPDAASIILSNTFDPASPPPGVSDGDWQQQCRLFTAFRTIDDPAAFTSRLDLYFGGGAYDGDALSRIGIIVPPWPSPAEIPASIVSAFPESLSGETWRAPTYFGTTLSTFGICCNLPRMAAQSIAAPPAHWADLADPAWAGTLGLADPTKSGSIAKIFETILQVACRTAVRAAGYDDTAIDAYERDIAAAALPLGVMPPSVPQAYQDAVEAGWADGIRLIQLLGANARYFTDSASKVPLDVGSGNAAAGLCIDFYGRFEADVANASAPSNAPVMMYLTPFAESGVSADPVSLLRGAPHRETALRFIEFILSPEGQKIWCYRPGTPGGPEKYALHRFPIRRDFYPSDDPALNAAALAHRPYTADDLFRPDLDAYALAASYVYRPRWTAGHFSMLRDLIRAMCMDADAELKAAWRAILQNGGPSANPEALAVLQTLPSAPEPLTWASAQTILKRNDRIDLLRLWTLHFRHQYHLAHTLATTPAP